MSISNECTRRLAILVPSFCLVVSSLLIYLPIAVQAQSSVASLSPSSNTSLSLPAPPHINMSNGTYFDFPSNDSLKLTAFTLSTWFNSDHMGPGNAFILSKGATGAGEEPGQNMNYGLYVSAGSRLRGGFETAEGQDYIVSPESKYADGKWHHVALTYDGNVLSMFIDRELQATNATGGALPDNNGDDPLRIGAKSSDASEGIFSGFLDDITVTNTPIDSTSVSQTGNSSKVLEIKSPPPSSGRNSLAYPPFFTR